MKKVLLKEEIEKYLKETDCLELLSALYSHATNYEIEASKKIVESMFNKSIDGIEKKLGTIDIINESKKSD